MGQTHSAPPEAARVFRRMARATYDGDLAALRRVFDPALVTLQISRATYLDLCVQEQGAIEAITDSLEREKQLHALQDERMEFVAAVERGRLVLGDTILHVAVRLGHEEIVDYLLLTDHRRPPTTAAVTMTTATASGLNTTQTPNFKGELPGDVAASDAMRLILASVGDVHEAFGVAYKDEPKVHRLVRALRRVWPRWMFEGPQEAAGLVRVLYQARSGDAAFGHLVKVTLATAERFRTAVTREGLGLATRLLRDAEGDAHAARRVALKDWPVEHKQGLLAAIFAAHFRPFQPQRRHGDDRDSAYIDFFDSAMDAWLTMAQDLQLLPVTESTRPCATTAPEQLPDAGTLRRFDLQVWKRRVRPPPALVDDLCAHIDALESYLGLGELSV